ncbi:MAG: amidohydrolase family protein [Actinobacteria bacterium]|nr:amidohydrolase family protein [Actinomycetota bacterium]
MKEDIHSYIADLPVFDVHEHHMPDILGDRDVGLLALLWQSYGGWTQARPYPLASETGTEYPVLADLGPGSWEEIARFVEGSGSNSFIRSLIRALTDLYDLDEDGITEQNWQRLDGEIRRRHSDDSWRHEVLDRARIERIITDPFENPMLNAREALGERYCSVLRINALAFGWHSESLDHNGNSAHQFARQLGHRLDTFDDYLAMLETLLDTMAGRHQVGLKNALAYDRSVNFDDVDEGLARQAWGQRHPTAAQCKAFGDVVVDRLCRLAGERDVPFQMHLGSAQIRGSHPMKAAGLIERHPKTRFLLMHLAFPWSRELLGLAFVYRNIWLDLTWSALLSPTYFKQALHEAIEVLPDESRLMIGGDNWHVEETYGAMQLMRRLIGEVLQEKGDNGYFRADDARRLARKILSGNASKFFGGDNTKCTVP